MSERNRFMSSSNPFLNVDHMESASRAQMQDLKSNPIDFFNNTKVANNAMTAKGAVTKTFILTGILIVTAIFAWSLANPALLWVGIIGGLISSIITYVKPNIANITAPIYAAFEGLLLGTISLFVAASMGEGFFGIVTNAIFLTIFALVAMLGAYKTGLIKPTEKFKSIVTTATLAIGMVYLVSMILSIFGITMPYLHEGGVIGIGLSLFIVGIASLNLIIDFESFETGEQLRLDKKQEWVCAMGLLITLVWLYLEILRLLSKINRD